MDTSQYMNMFLEESMDNLQVLNEALLDLEQEPNDIDKLNEIFRVAHTIKGMAATMGFNDIAELTHKMEDVLSNFREGKLEVTQDVVTILFDCLDTLERMVTNIEEENDEVVDINDIISSLQKISVSEPEKNIKILESKDEIDIQLNEYDLSIIKQAIQNSFNVINIEITLSENTLLKSARAFLIVQELESHGEIIKSIPTTEDIENEQFDTKLIFTIITSSEVDEIHNIVKNISEVEQVNTSTITIDDIAMNEEETKEENEDNKENDIKENDIKVNESIKSTTSEKR